jgi:hypothetical protein
MTTDAWAQAKSAVVSLWRRLRPAQADAVEADLDGARAGLIAAGGSHGTVLADEWAARLQDVAITGPQAATVLLDLAEALRRCAAGAERASAVRVEMHAKASGRGRVFQAGRDQEITGQ